MDAPTEEDQQSQSSIPKSSSFSPKVTRPKLPSFTGSKSAGTRHKTDPGRGEIKAIMEDIMNLNKVDFVKTYSRPRTLRSQTLHGKPSSSTHSSPSATPHLGSPDEPRASSLSRNRSSSRSLKLLTDKLKSGRYGDKGGNLGDPTADTNSKVVGLGCQVEVPEGDEISLYQTPRQSTGDSPESSLQPILDVPDPSTIYEGSAFVDDGDKADSVGSAGSSSRREKSPDPGDDSVPYLKVPEEEEHSEGEQPAPSASARPFHPTMSRNSPFLKLRATAPPQRRTGLTTIGSIGGLTWAKTSSTVSEEGGVRGEDHGNRRLPRPRDARQGAGGSKISPVLFVQHPHHRSASFREEGGLDSNGLTLLKSSSGDSESEGLISPYSIGDSHLGDSQDESGFQDAVSYLGSESLEPDYNERKNNGKSMKQKFNSDPSGHKTRELLELGGSFGSTHSHSAPSLVKEEVEGEMSPDFLIHEEEGIRMRPKLPSETLLSPVIVDETSMGQGSEDEFLEDVHESLGPTPKKSTSGFSPFSPPPSPHSHSPTGTMERDRSDPHRLSVNKRAISRSASTASVLSRDRKGLGSKEKEAVRKYSMTTDETMGGVKMGSSLTPDFTPIRDTGAAVSMPVVWKGPSTSDSPEREPTFIKDNRYHIVDELYRNEREYVEALKTLKEKYMVPLKTQSSLGETIVDNIFYMIPEILTHHTIYLDSLDNVWKNWDSKTSTIGNIIITTFSRQSVLESYLFFVENYKSSGRVIENTLQSKSSVQKFIEQCQRDSGNKLSMKDLIVRPIQRIPRYELLIQRLLDNTPKEHPDYPLLQQAEKVMHDLAVKIGTVNDSQHEEDMQETLKKLEDLLMTELAVPDRTYLRHDIVQILTKKDQCCIWLFSDLIIISSIKRKSGPVTRKVSIILKTPYGQDFAENVKQKTWLRVGLDDIEIVKSQGSLTRKPTVDREQVEEDMTLVSHITDLTTRLSTSHQALDEALRELSGALSRQLSECQMRSPTSESNKMELLVTTQENVLNLVIAFATAEKRAMWESAFVDAKSKLSLLSDRRAPEFLQPLQITKTRAGMQFSCAAPIDGVNAKGYRDVWVCNSDGYVGHMCLLSLQPEPIVTLNTPVPGCNARILCICAVPAYGGAFRRKTSQKGRVKPVQEDDSLSEAPRINVETVEDDEEEAETADGYQTDSESSEDDEELSFPHSRELYVASDDEAPRLSSPSPLTQASMDPITTSGNWVQDAHKSTMWMGTEDGCIHIFQCTDNIKTTKNKLKIQHGSAVQCIVYLDNKVFVSLCNGDLIVYKRDSEGLWDTEHPYTRTIGTASAPITRMLAVAGKLWCGCQNNVHVINPLTFNIEETFQVTQDTGRSVQCMVSSGQGVWIASQQSSKVNLFHATTYEYLMEVSIAQAVAQKLQSADDIIRQHKAACLRITALLICKDLMWVGTSAGVILSIPIPKITSTSTFGSLPTPTVTGLVHGHTGHVRFLTSVELSCIALKADGVTKETAMEGPVHGPDLHRRSSMAATTGTMASRMLVISGGDGYEDFRNSSTNEAAGRDDSTNHLLLWQV